MNDQVQLHTAAEATVSSVSQVSDPHRDPCSRTVGSKWVDLCNLGLYTIPAEE